MPLFVLLAPALCGQVCVPAGRLGANGAATGSLADTDCRLPGGTLYTEYTLVLPTRGQLQLEAASDTFRPALILRDSSGHAVASGPPMKTPAERGRYTVVVTAVFAGDSGPFQLSSTFDPEPDTFCKPLDTVGLNERMAGRLGRGSCRLPDGNAYDIYVLRTLGGGNLDIAMESGDFAPYVIVRGPDGHKVDAADNGRLAVQLDGGREYTVVASAGDGGSGAYQLALNFTPADEELCRPAGTLAAGDQDARSITPDGCAVTDSSGGKSYFNYYHLIVAEPGLAEFRMSAAGFDPTLQLMDGTGAVLASDSWSAGREQAVVRRYLRPGNYTLLALGAVSAAADYTLQSTLAPGPPPAAEVRSIDPAADVAGTLAVDTGITALYQVATPDAGTLEISLASSQFTPIVALLDERNNRIVADEFGTGSIVADLPAGVYTIVAATGDYPGGYELITKFTAHAPVPCPDAVFLDPSYRGYNGLLGRDSCRGANGQPVDWYTFTIPEDGTTALTMESGYLFGDLTIADAQGNVLRRDRNGLGGGNALIVQFLPGQTYRVAASGADGTPAGPYRLLRYFAPGPPAGCKPVRALAPGDQVDAQLNFTACQFPDDTFADFYKLEVSESTRFEIGMVSAEIDTYLLVLDARGNVMAEDDDSSGAGNALIDLALDPGTYQVVAKSSSGYTGGAYSLFLNAAQ